MKQLFVLTWLLAAGAMPASAAGFVILGEAPPSTELIDRHGIRPPPHPVPPPRPIPHPMPVALAPIETAMTRVSARVADQVAMTTVEQEFFNPNPAWLEGTFLFPMPRGAQLKKFTMEIDGKVVTAELLAADKARGIYEDIVRQMKDPALLEYAGRDLLRARIFPFEPNSRKRISLVYTELLKSDSGLIQYTCPLKSTGSSSRPIKTLSVRLDIETRKALKSVYSPSHKVEIRRDGNKATVSFEAGDVRPDADIQVYFSPDDHDVGLSLLTHKTSDGEGFFLLLASPGGELVSKKPQPKDVVFVLDTSGSMAGKKMDQARKALEFCVENLNDSDRFEIMRFSTETEGLFEKLSEAGKPNRMRAIEFIRDLKPIGGTAIEDALRKALALRPASGDRPYHIIFLTDGLPTIGVTDEDQIVASVQKANSGNTRIFCFGIGTDVNTHLLDRIADQTRAFSQYVLPEEDIEVKVSSFFTKVREPVFTSLSVHFPDGVRAGKLHPTTLPDLFKGEQLVLVGRYSTAAQGRITLEGKFGGEPRKFDYTGAFPSNSAENDFIPRLWATRRVGYLLDEIRLHGESRELRDEVTDLARKYGIVTPYTAYLIVEDEKRRGVAAATRSLRLLEDDVEAHRAAGESYALYKREKDGAAAVAGAEALRELKRADSVGLAVERAYLAAGREEATTRLRGASPGAPVAAATPAPLSPIAAGGGKGAERKLEPVARVQQYSQQSRFVGGKNFFGQDQQWVDSEAQKMATKERIRIQFNSKEYFDLAAKRPEALPWLALGRNVLFVLRGDLYEVFE
jgi:Ca-activated chloride channel family protein